MSTIETAEALDALPPEIAVYPGSDEDDQHVYIRDTTEGCWVAYVRADCVGVEEIPLPAYVPSQPAADQTPAKRCGECRLGLGVHTTTDPYCDHHKTPAIDSERDERLRGIQERVSAVTERPWARDGLSPVGRSSTWHRVGTQTGTHTTRSGKVMPSVDNAAVLTEGQPDAEFIAAAPDDVHFLLSEHDRLTAEVWRLRDANIRAFNTRVSLELYRGRGERITKLNAELAEQAATIERVIDRGLIQPAEWLGDKRTYSDELAEEPGNDAYMAYIERVLTASGYTDIPWGPVTLAITLDRLVRENEKAAALGSQRTEGQG